MFFKWLSPLWWKFMPGQEIEVPWPRGWTEPEECPGGGSVQIESADPNDHYRPHLEKLAGKQGWDWDWKLGYIDIGQGIRVSGDTLIIKFRKGKDRWASYFTLKWVK